MKTFFLLALTMTLPALALAVQRPAHSKKAEAPPALKTLYFDVNDTAIKEPELIRQNALWLKANSDKVILIEGHCDERGGDDFNLQLGDRRARAAMSALIREGVPEKQLVLVSFGKKKPAVTKPSETGWAANRRVEFRVR